MNGEAVPSCRGGPTRKPSEAVVERVAALEGVSPLEVTPPLYSAIDPDALDSLFVSRTTGERRSGVRLQFSFNGYDVEVGRDGVVCVAEA